MAETTGPLHPTFDAAGSNASTTTNPSTATADLIAGDSPNLADLAATKNAVWSTSKRRNVDQWRILTELPASQNRFVAHR
ncbi:hypothetical protein HPB52_017564 [Rhipicephalus sanguineus]|uniref:Uncharacterized protein n=1 Tax=Rhipicephalus sanguineus TaxID=34632 RepID=A0A9D4TB55_RHISA|nr:hypothetical protein HPB52_017564 [Rhipicephalus sanguineus]